jgi:hypothetical protein
MAQAKPHLVWKHLERVSAKIFEEYRSVITNEVFREHGVYALYKGTSLYYVGLAKDLKRRLKAHLKDRHSGKWNYFSAYLTTGDHHLRELEALLIRIAQPKGNRNGGKLKGSQDLKRTLKSQLKRANEQKVNTLFDQGSKAKATVKGPALPKELAKLAKTISLPLRIRATHRKVTHRATLRRDGKVRYAGKVYSSLSKAGTAATGRPTNGWTFWSCERGKGHWVKLNTIRK